MKIPTLQDVDPFPAMRLVRVEKTERELIQEALDEPHNGEVFDNAEDLIKALDAIEPTPQPEPQAQEQRLLVPGQKVICGFADNCNVLAEFVEYAGAWIKVILIGGGELNAGKHAMFPCWRMPTEAELAEHTPQHAEQSEGGWVKHDGGECPVEEGTIVQLRIVRDDGSNFEETEAKEARLDWRWERGGPRARNIIAYRLVEPK